MTSRKPSPCHLKTSVKCGEQKWKHETVVRRRLQLKSLTGFWSCRRSFEPYVDVGSESPHKGFCTRARPPPSKVCPELGPPATSRAFQLSALWSFPRAFYLYSPPSRLESPPFSLRLPSMANQKEAEPLLPPGPDAAPKPGERSPPASVKRPARRATNESPIGRGSFVGEPVAHNQWSTGLFYCLGGNDEFWSSDMEVCASPRLPSPPPPPSIHGFLFPF